MLKKSVFSGGGFVLVVTASSCFTLPFYQHLKTADHNGIAFLGDETETFDNVVFALNKNGLL